MDKRKWKYWIFPTILFFPMSTFWFETYEWIAGQEHSSKKTIQYFSTETTNNTLVISNHSEKEIRKKFKKIEDKIMTLEEELYLPEGEESIVLPLYLSRMSGSILFGTHFVKGDK